MMDLESSIIGAIVAVVILGVVGFFAWCIIDNNRRYYDAQTQCVQAHGSWVPTPGQSGACIMSARP